MAARRNSKRGEGGRRGVVRRPPSERKRLSPEFEELARGEQDRPRRPRRGPRLQDPRTVGLVPGVANRDARSIYDARRATLEQAAQHSPEADPDRATLAQGLAEAVQLGLWRGRSITGFDAFAEQVLGIEAREARELAQRGATSLGVPCARVSDEAVAAWMRAEAALLHAGIPGRVRCVRDAEGREQLRFDVDAARAPDAMDRIAHRMGPLIKDRRPRRKESRHKG